MKKIIGGEFAIENKVLDSVELDTTENLEESEGLYSSGRAALYAILKACVAPTGGGIVPRLCMCISG